MPEADEDSNRPDIAEGVTLDRLDRGATQELRESTAPRGLAGDGELAFTPGQMFGPYLLHRVLGKGGFGQVWEAENQTTGRRLALKILSRAALAGDEEVERFRREGRLAASLSHPRCVYVFAAEEILGHPTIAMELMPGGTLEGKLKGGKSLKVSDAVDYVLDMIDGLEAAHEKGFIHRDIKPANCFLDADGRVRIGDFGLSKSLSGDAKLTITGVYMGTPAYSSPEQVKGRELDVRSDIYAVGATLYSLLVGQPPFTGTQVGQVLARILSEPPESVTKRNSAVPRDLEKVVLKMLEKEKEKRFPDYPALRSALLPYASGGVSGVVGLGRRLLASWLDGLVLMLCYFTSASAIGSVTGWSVDLMFSPGTATFLLVSGFRVLLVWAYYTFFEGLTGWSPGKLVIGLRVKALGGLRMTWSQAASRSAVFALVTSLPSLALEGLENPFFSQIGPLVGLVIVFGRARAANAYAGLHEQLSGTRVVSQQLPRTATAPLRDEVETRLLPSAEGEMIGPYQVIRTLWRSDESALLLGFDPGLDRNVWLRRFTDPRRTPALESLGTLRVGRLRWLKGARTETEAWDAFERPTGVALLQLITRRGRQEWPMIKAVLSGLVQELDARRQAGAGAVGLEHIWVDADGLPKVLDFNAPLDAELVVPEPPKEACESRVLLRQFLVSALEGRIATPSDARSRPKAPLPLHIEPLLIRIFDAAAPNDDLSDVRTETDRIALLPSRIDRKRRLGALCVSVGIPAVFLLFLAGSLAYTIRVNAGVGNFRLLLSVWRDLGKGDQSADTTEDRAAVAAFIVSKYSRAKTQSSPATFEDAGYRASLARLSSSDVKVIESLVEAQGPLDAAQTASARERVRELFSRPMTLGPSLANVVLQLAGFIALVALVTSGLFRGGAALAACGMAVRTTEGRVASRFRCLLRTGLAYAPLIAAAAFHHWVWPVIQADQQSSVTTLPAIAALAYGTMIAGAAFAVLHPEEGLQDRICRTRLVPR